MDKAKATAVLAVVVELGTVAPGMFCRVPESHILHRFASVDHKAVRSALLALVTTGALVREVRTGSKRITTGAFASGGSRTIRSVEYKIVRISA